jgi:ubiquinone/menaquinone biosynthesis C-methylase UbiE
LSDEFIERSTSSSSLDARLDANKLSQKIDFKEWSVNTLSPKEGDKVLEIGCGTGSQTKPVAEIIGDRGSLTFVDLSAQSVATVRKKLGSLTTYRGIVGNMDEIDNLLVSDKTKFDLIFSVYALYYSNRPERLLESLFNRLSSEGRLCIIGPESPHGFVELARKYFQIPQEVDRSLNFRTEVVEGFLKKNFQAYDVVVIRNPQFFYQAKDAIEFFRNTTYYSQRFERQIFEFIENEILDKSVFMVDKYSSAVIAQVSPGKSK